MQLMSKTQKFSIALLAVNYSIYFPNMPQQQQHKHKQSNDEDESNSDSPKRTFKRPAARVIERALQQYGDITNTNNTNNNTTTTTTTTTTKSMIEKREREENNERTIVMPESVYKTTKPILPKDFIVKETVVDCDLVVKEMLSRRKLPLVLDLDLTLVHSVEIAKFNDHAEALGKMKTMLELKKKKYFQVSGQFLTKIRPHARQFLEEVSSMYELYVVTAGSQCYANAIANEVLDPQGLYFGQQLGLTNKRVKGLKTWNPELNVLVDVKEKYLPEDLEGGESVTLIIEDKPEMWDKEMKPYIVQVKPYVHFPEADFSDEGLRASNFFNMKDESDSSQSYLLHNILPCLKNIWHMMFDEAIPKISGVIRNEKNLIVKKDLKDKYWPSLDQFIEFEQKRILKNCFLCFTGCFFVDKGTQKVRKPHQQELWKEAKELGAQPQEEFVDNAALARRVGPVIKDDRTTHVVVGEGVKLDENGNRCNTGKINSAIKNNKSLVTPSWIAESKLLWKPAPELDFKPNGVFKTPASVSVSKNGSSRKRPKTVS